MTARRSGIRCFAWIACLAAGAPAVRAADIIVNDAGTAVFASDGKCTLLEAVAAANSDTASGGTVGECAAGSGPDTIRLQAATQLYTLITVNNDSGAGPNGLPLVFTSITIEGNDAVVQRSGAAGTPEFRLFQVASTGALTLRGVALRNGRAAFAGALLNAYGIVVLELSEVSASQGVCDGGGIATYGGSLTLVNSLVRDNIAGCSGGAIFARDGSVSLTDTSLLANVSSAGGGGALMLFETPSATLLRTTIDGNTAVLDGGGVLTHGAATNTTIIDSDIVNNRCEPRPGDIIGGNGGGIAHGRVDNDGTVAPFVAGGIMLIQGSTISGNVGARNSMQTTAPFGGGISSVGQLTIENSTITQNLAANGRGGGIFTIDPAGSPSGLVLRDSVVGENDAGTGTGGGVLALGEATIERTHVRANTASNGAGVMVRLDTSPGASGGATRIVASTLSGNVGFVGAALHVTAGVVARTELVSSTVSGNVAGNEFGGASLEVSSAVLLNGVTLVDNSGGRGGIASSAPVEIYNTIIAGNSDFSGAEVDCFLRAGGSFVSAYSLIGQVGGCPVAGTGNTTIVPTQLFTQVIAPLEGNAAVMPAHVPLPGSPALDTGDPVSASLAYPQGCPLADQRGRARPQDDDGDGIAICDRGAIEGEPLIFRDGFE